MELSLSVCVLLLSFPECERPQQWSPAVFTQHIYLQERKLRDGPVPAVLVPGVGRLVWRFPEPRQAWRALAKFFLLGYSRWELWGGLILFKHILVHEIVWNCLKVSTLLWSKLDFSYYSFIWYFHLVFGKNLVKTPVATGRDPNDIILLQQRPKTCLIHWRTLTLSTHSPDEITCLPG